MPLVCPVPQEGWGVTESFPVRLRPPGSEQHLLQGGRGVALDFLCLSGFGVLRFFILTSLFHTYLLSFYTLLDPSIGFRNTAELPFCQERQRIINEWRSK